jgi:DNA repair protein SbcD/Mre11
MRFAHLADVHIGAWRDPKMKDLPLLAFEQAVSKILGKKADFVLIAGDLFNTSVPPLDMVKRAVTQFQRLKGAGIPVYAIAGSHDYSPSGKTMLDVLEEAGLLVNVMKGEVTDEADGKGRLKLRFTQDKKTGVKLTGILGRAGSLDRHYYEDLDRESLEREPGEKIFLFHAPITELKPEELERMDSQPVSMLPKGFSYYAGGHVHIIGETSLPGYTHVVYPGPLFPASFSELEELGQGGFCMVEDGKVLRIPVLVRERITFSIHAEKKSAEEVNAALRELEEEKVGEKIVLLRVAGELREGRVSDLKFKELFRRLSENGAYFVMKNTAKLSSKEFEEFQASHGNADEVEEKTIREHAGQAPIGLTLDEEVALTKELFAVLGEEQSEGEKKYEYEERLVKAGKERLER